MNSFEINKILGAILFTCLGLVALNITAGALFAPEIPAKPGYEIAVKPAPSETGKAAPAEVPIEKALASADLKRGEATAKVCQTCHNLTKGAGPKVGPDLWDVVGRPKGSVAGFGYSDAMKSKGGDWTVADLNTFLTNPRGFVPGTKMTFAGLPREDQRADIIAYLNTLSEHPKPLPTAATGPGEPAKSAAAPPQNPPQPTPPATAAPAAPPANAAPVAPPANAAPPAPPADHKPD